MERKAKHFVLNHGACHGAWCWYKLATMLRSAGHRVTALDLAAAGVNRKRVEELRSVSDYFQPLMEFMATLPPEEKVILVGHSFGGVSTSVAMEEFPEKISVAVFVTAMMPGPDFTIATILQEMYKRMDSQMDNHHTFDQGPHNPPTSLLLGPEFLASKLYQLCPPEDLTLATMLVTPVGMYADAEMCKDTAVTKEKYGSISRVYIVCEEDKVIDEDLQRWMIQNNPTEEVKTIPGSDHMAMLSKPQELCTYLLEIAHTYS